MVCFVSVTATQKLDAYVKDMQGQKAAQQLAQSLPAKANAAAPKNQMAGLHYDYLPVGSIPEQAAKNVILDPCLGRPK